MASGDVTEKSLTNGTNGGPVQLGTSPTTIVNADTIAGNTKTVKQLIICNTDNIERWVTIGVDSVSAESCILYQLPIAGNDTVVLDTVISLKPASIGGVSYGYLYGISDTADKVTVYASGWEREA